MRTSLVEHLFDTSVLFEQRNLHAVTQTPAQHGAVATRQRLLEVAAEVFAEHGFHNSRVRDICARAGANVAAVNYHFRDKMGLYEEVLRHAFLAMSGGAPAGPELADISAQLRLRAFVTDLLSQLLSEGRTAMYAKLVAREMVDATSAITCVIEDGIRPQMQFLFATVRELLGTEADDQLVRRCASSIIGQCMFYHTARPAILQLPLEERLDPDAVEPIASHIAAFSLAAIERLAGEPPLPCIS